MHDTYYLVAIMDNNYIESNLFDIFWNVMRKISNNGESSSSGESVSVTASVDMHITTSSADVNTK